MIWLWHATSPAVNWDVVPADIIQTETVQMTGSVYMPWEADPVANARVRVTVDAADDFGNVGSAEGRISRILTLWAEGEEEVVAAAKLWNSQF